MSNFGPMCGGHGGQGGQGGSGSQGGQPYKLNDMHSENIWFIWCKPLDY